jgi:hypothetical protein
MPMPASKVPQCRAELPLLGCPEGPEPAMGLCSLGFVSSFANVSAGSLGRWRSPHGTHGTCHWHDGPGPPGRAHSVRGTVPLSDGRHSRLKKMGVLKPKEMAVCLQVPRHGPYSALA